MDRVRRVFIAADFQQRSVDIAEGNAHLLLAFDQTKQRNFVCGSESGQVADRRVLGGWEPVSRLVSPPPPGAAHFSFVPPSTTTRSKFSRGPLLAPFPPFLFVPPPFCPRPQPS